MLPVRLRLMLAAGAMPVLAAAQVPPAPPVLPAPPVMPVPPMAVMPAPEPMPAPLPLIAPHLDDAHLAAKLAGADFPMLLAPSIEFGTRLDLARVTELELRAHEAAMRVHERSLLEHERVQELALRAHEDSRLVHEHIHLDAHRMSLEAFERPALAPVPAIAPLPALPGTVRDAFEAARPRPAWAPNDPADSLYRLARETLNRGEYRRAAQLFNELTRKHPSSKYAMDSAYWEAFARYRIGTTDDLRVALTILDGKGEVPLNVEAMLRQGRESSSHAIDIPALRARVQGALAARGDEKAAEALRRNAAQGSGCDREEISVRAEALQALAQMDREAAMPVVRRVLATRDECTVELRRRALYLVGRYPDNESSAVILDVARHDPDQNIRSEAMRWLPRVAGDGAIPALQELLRTESEERMQRAVVSALGSIDSDDARRAIRTIIERTDANERVRYDAILTIGREREGRSLSADDVAYLRGLYTKLEPTKLREAVIHAIGRQAGAENEQFLHGIVRNVNETASLRAAALQRLGRMEQVKVADIAKLYDIADARSLREQVLYALSQRKEPDAIDKLMEIARKDTDPQIRRTAISLLARSNNERAKQLLKELIDQ